LRLVAFLLFLNPQCLASISRWITASSSWKRFCLFVCRALSSIMVICMLTAIRLLLTFVMSLEGVYCSRCVYYGKHQSFQATAGFRDYAPNAYSSSNGWSVFYQRPNQRNDSQG